jgi:hypothetical protein
MNITQIFNALFNGGNYTKPFLIKLSHPTAGTLRFINNNEAVTYQNQTYQPANFNYNPPDSQGSGASLEIGIADNYQIVEWVANADERYSMEVIGCLFDGEVQQIRAYKHFYGTVSMADDGKIVFALEDDGRLGMVFTVYKYDTALNPGNA